MPCRANAEGASEPVAQLYPCPPGSTRREERSALQGEASCVIAARVCRKRTGQKGSLRSQTRVGELCRRIVSMIEEIIHLERDPETFRQIVMHPEVGDRVTRRNARPEIINSVRPIRVVLIPPRVGTRNRDLVNVDAELRGYLKRCVGLAILFRNQGNPIAGLNINVAVESRTTGKRRIAGVVGPSIQYLVAPVGGFQISPVKAPSDAPDAAVKTGVETLPTRLDRKSVV